MSRLIDELRKLAPGRLDLSATQDEVCKIIGILEDRARAAARRGEKSVGLCLDKFIRTGVLAGTKLPRQAIPSLEQHFRNQGVSVCFANDMSCGVCNIADCKLKAHYGYILEWDFKTPE